MAPNTTIQVLDHSRVSPPPGSVASTVLPLICFDVAFIGMHSVERLFFYEVPCSTTDFLGTHLPNLKHSLALTLQLFFPLVGNLTYSPCTPEYEILYVEGDSVSLTVAEMDADFHWFVANHAKNIASFHPLVPKLPISDPQKVPLLALQVTVFPNSGICIGVTVHHVAADGSSSIQFMRSWASICRTDVPTITSVPSHNRTMTEDLDRLKRRFMLERGKAKINDKIEGLESGNKSQESPLVLATFIMDQAKIEGLRKWVLARTELVEKPFHCSAFVLTAAYMWVSLVRAKGNVEDKLAHFIFAVDLRSRLNPPLSATYFGNGSGCVFTEARQTKLAQVHGLVVAAKAIGRAVQGLQEDLLGDAENFFTKFESIISKGELVLATAGSPRFGVYEVDFGFGKPRKVEVISIAKSGAISLAETRDEKGRLEVGLALAHNEMEAFVSVFNEGLKILD